MSRSSADDVENLGGWLTTVVSRVCLDMLRSCTARREHPLDTPIHEATPREPQAIDPEQEALLTDSVARSPAAARQLASRARRRVQGAATDTTGELERETNNGHEMKMYRWGEFAELCGRHGELVARATANFLTAFSDPTPFEAMSDEERAQLVSLRTPALPGTRRPRWRHAHAGGPPRGVGPG